jgi:hypothetical protein
MPSSSNTIVTTRQCKGERSEMSDPMNHKFFEGKAWIRASDYDLLSDERNILAERLRSRASVLKSRQAECPYCKVNCARTKLTDGTYAHIFENPEKGISWGEPCSNTKAVVK